MSVGEYCNREVVIVDKTEPVREAVHLMRSHHVGDVVVVEKRGDLPVPVGILTDRDIVIEILAEGVDIDAVNIGDVMSFELVTVDDSMPLLDAINLMRTKGVRRLPVVDASGSLTGILTVDDILELVTEQLTGVVGLLLREQAQEIKKRQ